MHRRRVAAGICLAGVFFAGVFFGGPASLLAAEAEPSAAQRAAGREAMDAFDQSLRSLRESVWDTYEARSRSGIDTRGRNVGDDVRDYVLAPQNLKRIQALRAKAAQDFAAADSTAGTADLDEAKTLLTAETDRMVFIWSYWTGVEALGFHEDLWRPLAEQVAKPVRDASRSRLDGLTAEMVETVREPFDRDALRQRFESLVAAYNSERRYLVRQVAARRAAAGEALPGRDRQTPCPRPAPGTSGSEKPRISKRVSPAELYPPSERKSEVEGYVTLQLHISESGCLVRVDISESSGSPALDRAAMDGAEQCEFLPAEKDRHPVASTMPLQFVFVLK